MNDWLARVAEKVARLRAMNPTHHSFQPLPRSSNAEVAAWEAALGIQLPEDYRRYITEIANGGIGPADGLMRFGHCESWETLPYVTGCRQYWEFWRNTIRSRESVEAIARPFPFTESVFLLTRSSEEILAWYEEHDDHCGDGLLTLADYGCGQYAMLVVSGAARGQVWKFCLSSDAGIWKFGEEYPPFPDQGNYLPPPVLVTPPPAPWSFATWFEHWLDEVLASPAFLAEDTPRDAEIRKWIDENLPEDALSMPPEEFVARYGHRRFLVENCWWSKCADPDLERWIHLFQELISDPTAVERCREEYLPPDECERLRELEVKDVRECFRPCPPRPRVP